MEDAQKTLTLPEEPTRLRAEIRTLLEHSPEEGARVISDAAFVSGLFWDKWGEGLEEAGMGRGRFQEIARGYAGELRLWVVGERPWDHCAAGLAGRVSRRLPASQTQTDLAEVDR
ncbi:MAG: hypothetical protein M3Q49_22530 [Actinomycetota bacterium]|nr:hypothetical protein [Actinomycetota bacterium]MDP9488525.1 hypothetical protein [Actinomycetota bacterium]